jgi:hypothetical protein
MTPRQLAILREYGGRMLADLLINPDRGISHAKQSRYGRTSFPVEGAEFWMETTSRGIELPRWSTDTGTERRVCEVVPWSQVARFARSLPASLVVELRSHREQLTNSTLAQPPFPVRASAEEKQRWERTVYTPWLARRRAITAALEAALDRALLTGRVEQAALFDVATTRARPATTRPTDSVGRPDQGRLL